MKVNKKIILKSILGLSISIGVSAAVVLPISLSTIHQDIFGKQISSNLLVLQLSQTNQGNALSDFTVSTVDVNRALYGSTNVNGGNYMVGYMTLSNIQGTETFDFPSTSSNWDWIQSFRTGSGAPIITGNIEQIFVNNEFVQSFFNPINGLSSVANFYLIIDINPKIGAEIEKDTEHVPQRFANPSSIWTQDLILDQFNFFHPNNPANPITGLRPNSYGSRPFIDIFEDLPQGEIDKENQFIRDDSSAVEYRKITDFVKRWKPQINGMTGTTNDLSGFVAYTQTKSIDNSNPNHIPTIKNYLSFQVPKEDVTITIDQLRNYYLNES